MLLSPDDAQLFFKLMPALQVFGNQTLKILPELKDTEGYKKITHEARFKLREALYKHPEIITAFVTENPFGFSKDELAIVAGWKNFIDGEFYLARYLKKYAILVSKDKVYGVLGLTEPLEYVTAGRPLPIYLQTVLLPFKGQIIYDGFILPYNVHFGGGISRSVADQYRAAKVQGRIIESLEPGWQAPVISRPRVEKDWRPLVDELLEKTTKLKAASDDPAMVAPAFKLLRASLEFARATLEDPENTEALNKSYHKVVLAANKIYKTLELLEY